MWIGYKLQLLNGRPKRMFSSFQAYGPALQCVLGQRPLSSQCKFGPKFIPRQFEAFQQDNMIQDKKTLFLDL